MEKATFATYSCPLTSIKNSKKDFTRVKATKFQIKKVSVRVMVTYLCTSSESTQGGCLVYSAV